MAGRACASGAVVAIRKEQHRRPRIALGRTSLSRDLIGPTSTPGITSFGRGCFYPHYSDQTAIAIPAISIAVRKPRVAEIATTQATVVRKGRLNVPRRALIHCVEFSKFSAKAR